MLTQTRRSWEALKRDPPGERFHRHYRRRHEQERSRLIRLRVVGLASVLIGVGVVLLFVPGPGTVLIGLGAAVVADRCDRRFGPRTVSSRCPESCGPNRPDSGTAFPLNSQVGHPCPSFCQQRMK